jgi:hypothetical protein
MRSKQSRGATGVTALAVGVATFVTLGWPGRVYAAPIDPKVHKERYEKACKGAEVVAQVRVLAATCTDVKVEKDAPSSVTLQLSLQVLAVEKGPVKKNDVLTVALDVNLPRRDTDPFGVNYVEAQRQFPFTPGVKGSVALRWDAKARRYEPVAGWVPDLGKAAIPTAVGKAFVAGDADKGK